MSKRSAPMNGAPSTDDAPRPISDVDHFKIPPDVYAAIFQVLGSRPYMEVAQVMNALSARAQAVMREDVLRVLSAERQQALDLADAVERAIAPLRYQSAGQDAVSLIEITRVLKELDGAVAQAISPQGLDETKGGAQHATH